LEAATSAAAASGYRRLILPPGQINLQSDWDITSLPTGFEIIGSGSDTVLKHTGGTLSKALIHVRGSDGTKTALASDLAANTATVTLPSAVASTLAVGDIVGFESTLTAFTQGAVNAGASELHKVISVSGTTVNLDSPLIWPYTISASAVCWRVSPLKQVALRNFTLTSSDPLVNRLRGIYASKIDGLELTDITARDAGGGLFVHDCMDSLVSRVRIDRLPNTGDFRGYGVTALGRTAKLLVENLWGRGCRHVFTTLGDERPDTTVWGGPRDVIVRSGVGEISGGFAVWDTHPHGYRIIFDNCLATGGLGAGGDAFQIRAKYVSLVNPVSYRAGGSGFQLDPAATGTRILGGEVAFATAGGASLANDTEINGTVFRDNTGAGAVVGVNAAGSRILNCRFERNTYGLHDQSAGEHTGVLVTGNYIPKSAGVQTVSIQSPKSNMLITQNIMTGYGPGLDGVSGSIGASVTRTANIIDI